MIASNACGPMGRLGVVLTYIGTVNARSSYTLST